MAPSQNTVMLVDKAALHGRQRLAVCSPLFDVFAPTLQMRRMDERCRYIATLEVPDMNTQFFHKISRVAETATYRRYDDRSGAYWTAEYNRAAQ